jgi:hypothetical protein
MTASRDIASCIVRGWENAMLQQCLSFSSDKDYHEVVVVDCGAV